MCHGVPLVYLLFTNPWRDKGDMVAHLNMEIFEHYCLSTDGVEITECSADRQGKNRQPKDWWVRIESCRLSLHVQNCATGYVRGRIASVLAQKPRRVEPKILSTVMDNSDRREMLRLTSIAIALRDWVGRHRPNPGVQCGWSTFELLLGFCLLANKICGALPLRVDSSLTMALRRHAVSFSGLASVVQVRARSRPWCQRSFVLLYFSIAMSAKFPRRSDIVSCPSCSHALRQTVPNLPPPGHTPP